MLLQCFVALNKMHDKQIPLLLDNYLKARIAFAQGVADYAVRECTVGALQEAHELIIPLLRPLLLDASIPVQLAAAVAVGRLANHSQELASNIVSMDVLPHIVFALNESKNKFFRKSAAFALRCIAKHDGDLAKQVVDARAIDTLTCCLSDGDAGVRESASHALGFIAKHKEELATTIMESGAVPALVACLHEPEISLRRVCASALGDIARHSPELAQGVVDAMAISKLVPLIQSSDAKLRRQVCLSLSQIAMHSIDLAEAVVDGEVFPLALACFKDMDGNVRKQVTVLVSEITKHSAELSQLLVNCGAVAAIVDYLAESKQHARIPAIMALGYISAFSETLALAVIVSQGIPPLVDALQNEKDVELRASCAWALGQMGRHSPDHAKTVAAHSVLPKLLHLLTNDASNSDSLSQKVKRALKGIIAKTLEPSAMEPLVNMKTPPSILKSVLSQFAKILPTSVDARKQFVTSGCCQRVQEIHCAYSTQQSSSEYSMTKMAETIRLINSCFPEEIIRYYSPGYSSALLQRIEDFSIKPLTPEKIVSKASSIQKLGSNQRIVQEEEVKPAQQVA